MKVVLHFLDTTLVFQDQFCYSFSSFGEQAYDVDLSLSVQMAQPLAHFASPVAFVAEKVSSSEVRASFQGKSASISQDQWFYFSTKDIEEPQLLAAMNEKRPGKVAVMFQVAPTFARREQIKDPQDILINNGPLESKKKQALDTEGGSFIFLVDRSGSMSSGPRTPLTREAMSLFMQSLPIGSRFQIISYGTSH